MALRWKKNKRPTGLAGVAMMRPLGSTLSDGNIKYASVDALREGGWYYVCGLGGSAPRINTCNDPSPDEATAKAEAMAYVLKHIKSQPRNKL